MPNLDDAIALAVEIHSGQQNRYGEPEILHALRVMLRLEGEIAQMVGVLHDVIEDSDLTLDDLRNKGYAAEIVAAMDGVTRRDNESYDEFVERNLQHPLSRQVRLADLEDKLDLRRLPADLSGKDVERLRRHRRAWERLRD